MTEADIAEKGESGDNYERALQHWNSTASDVNGMLGGFEKLHIPDINGSKQFLLDLRRNKFVDKFERALDCGCGIGRITKHLLQPIFSLVDMVDFSEKLIKASFSYVDSSMNHEIGDRFVESLHTFTPKKNYYDVIWIQWVTGYFATDEHFVDFLQRCIEALKESGGCIVVKDNIAKGPDRIFDEEDNSWTRTSEQLGSIFAKADLQLIQQRRQLHFPKEIYEVRMFALKPR